MSINLFPAKAVQGELIKYSQIGNKQFKIFTKAGDVVDIDALANKGLKYKANPFLDELKGNHVRVGLLFLNPSMRTRMSTQVAGRNLGMDVIVFNIDKEGWQLEFGDGVVMNGNKAEHIKEAAPVLGSYFDILGIRTFPSLQNRAEDYSESYISEFIKYCGVPVVSLESATRHPLQSLTDIITMKESLAQQPITPGKKLKIVHTWAPHIKPCPQAVSNSFCEWVNAWGKADFVVANPEGMDLAEEFTKGATVTHNQEEALEGADFVYVKNWSSYDWKGEYGKNYDAPDASSWLLTLDKLKNTNNAKVMHCLPVRRGVELTDEVLDSDHSLITTEAGNRVWAAQAVLSELL
ncbi:Rossmann-fold NAD(P)-binding domain-containing protein [Rhizosphaericola mali]|uniref:N-succinylornithine carbamoyltransferase n=1 Tax=Rhizosphaericola mali TaxID=2545455 RepID=A0A5P2GF34_9BACT|nr:acetylornithine carbamoyltransferase [Rhizosphaericola mali]QES90221.1 acetylornithine carbamoyltransferase [Rhizosphaericola mali]